MRRRSGRASSKTLARRPGQFFAMEMTQCVRPLASRSRYRAHAPLPTPGVYRCGRLLPRDRASQPDSANADAFHDVSAAHLRSAATARSRDVPVPALPRRANHLTLARVFRESAAHFPGGFARVDECAARGCDKQNSVRLSLVPARSFRTHQANSKAKCK